MTSVNDSAEASAEDKPVQPLPGLSVRDRLIPAVTIVLVMSLLGLLAYALFAPRAGSSLGSGGRVNTVGSLIVLNNREAPNFTLTTFSGETITLEEFRGKTVVINFWASWCPPCRDEAPVLAELDRTRDPDKVVLIGVAVWDREADSRAFLRSFGLTFPNGPDKSGSIAIDYGVSGVPETFFIGPDGTLLGKYPGPLTSAEQIHDLLQDLGALQ